MGQVIFPCILSPFFSLFVLDGEMICFCIFNGLGIVKKLRYWGLGRAVCTELGKAIQILFDENPTFLLPPLSCSLSLRVRNLNHGTSPSNQLLLSLVHSWCLLGFKFAFMQMNRRQIKYRKQKESSIELREKAEEEKS